MKSTPKKKKYTSAELLELRNKELVKEFNRLTSPPHHKDATYVVEQVLQFKFYIQPDTIWNIVRGTGHYKLTKKK